jgi:hypothetical protein
MVTCGEGEGRGGKEAIGHVTEAALSGRRLGAGIERIF